jgi:hypothetical protein
MTQENECKKNFSELQNYCNKRKAFHHLSAQKINELETTASSLQSLAVRARENMDRCLVETDATLLSLIEEIRKISDTIQGTGKYIKRLNEGTINSVSFSSENVQLNDLLLEFFIKTNDDQIVTQNFMSIAASLKNSIGMLNSKILSPNSRKCRNEHFGFRLLFAAVAMINESAKKARETVDLIQGEEKERKKLDHEIHLLALEESNRVRYPNSANLYVI